MSLQFVSQGGQVSPIRSQKSSGEAFNQGGTTSAAGGGGVATDSGQSHDAIPRQLRLQSLSIEIIQRTWEEISSEELGYFALDSHIHTMFDDENSMKVLQALNSGLFNSFTISDVQFTADNFIIMSDQLSSTDENEVASFVQGNKIVTFAITGRKDYMDGFCFKDMVFTSNEAQAPNNTYTYPYASAGVDRLWKAPYVTDGTGPGDFQNLEIMGLKPRAITTRSIGEATTQPDGPFILAASSWFHKTGDFAINEAINFVGITNQFQFNNTESPRELTPLEWTICRHMPTKGTSVNIPYPNPYIRHVKNLVDYKILDADDSITASVITNYPDQIVISNCVSKTSSATWGTSTLPLIPQVADVAPTLNYSADPVLSPVRATWARDGPGSTVAYSIHCVRPHYPTRNNPALHKNVQANYASDFQKDCNPLKHHFITMIPMQKKGGQRIPQRATFQLQQRCVVTFYAHNDVIDTDISNDLNVRHVRGELVDEKAAHTKRFFYM